MMTLKQLRYFSALARCRHFGRAASECAISQPALSMQIRELEKTLGVDLVERRPGDVSLTPVGLDFAKQGEQVLAAVRDLADLARHHGRTLAGRLQLGIIPTLAPYVLPKILPELQRRYPELRVELRETQTRFLLDELMRGGLDLLLLALPVDEPEVDTIPLFDDCFVLAVRADDPRPASMRLDAQAIERETLILLEEGHCLRDQSLAYCRGVRREQSMRLGATSLATVIQMVANGYGATLLPQVAAEVEARDARIKLLRFAAPEPGRSIGLAFRRTSPRKADFAALGELVTEALGAVR
ncbi:MAG TPA: LysR substrate-binding domain-containing protein [Rhodoplanes sp.]|nr:LysR substrate-binding domain-containing protein [Rhodoplanes sp.]